MNRLDENKAICIINIKDKTKTIFKIKDKDKDKDKTFHYVWKQPIKERKGDWIKKQIVWVFWNNKHISELCEKWIYRNHEYGYTRFEELRTCSGEVVYAREHKAITTKRKKTHLFRY